MKLTTFLYSVAALVGLAMPLAASADTTRTNPVTGETETYVNVFTGATSEWNSADNWDTAVVPFVSSGDFDPSLVDGKTASTETAIDGWTLRVGAYNGANITWSGGINKIQGSTTGCWLTADATSKITIASFAGNQLENNGNNVVFKLTSASAGGITWSAGLSSTSGYQNLEFQYYLGGSGTIVYGGNITVSNAQVIRRAEVTLSGGTKSLKSKTLVTFGSGTTKSFTANAKIKIKNSSGDDVTEVALASVTSGSPTLTTSAGVGKCELVQTSTGIVLYWVDGDPSEIVDKTYKPSISINFTNGAANGLTTAADVGLSGYEVPGTSWNNYVVANNATFSTVNAVGPSGDAFAVSGMIVTISGTRGSYSCSELTAASNPLHAYIDEEAGNPTPTVTVTGIPFAKYRVIVYHSTDSANVPFGYDTINGTDYTYVDGDLTEGTTAWGSSGASNSANAITKGGNALLTGELSDSTLTVVGHRGGGANNARGCIAAIQIIEVKQDVGGDGDLVIEVYGDITYTVDSAQTVNGTVYLTGLGTITLDGSAKITANTINVGSGVTLNVNANRLDASTFAGSGTVAYTGVVPPTGKGWTDSAWTGTVWIRNKSGITGNNNASTGVQPNNLGNSLSKVKFSGVSGWLEAPITYNPEIVLENDSYSYALQLTNGNSPNGSFPNRATIIQKLSGSGTLGCGGPSSAVPALRVYDASGFTGSIDTVNASGDAKTGLVVVFCDEETTLPNTLVSMFINSSLKRTIYVASGNEVSFGSASTWTAATGFWIEGTLNASGTLSSSASVAVKGAGTVVFGGVPSPTGDAWWKNSAWTGTVEIKGVSNITGSYTFNDYGNAGSTVKLTDCRGWLKNNYTCDPALEIGGTFTWSDGASGLNNAFKVATLKGSGTISIPTGGAVTAVWQITDDWSGFTGSVVGNRTDGRRVLVFGSTLPSTISAGEIYVSPGAALEIHPDANWWTLGKGLVVAGAFGGTGSFEGAIEFVSGSAFKVFSADEEEDGFAISGTVTIPTGDSEKLTIDATEVDSDGDIILIYTDSSLSETFGLADNESDADLLNHIEVQGDYTAHAEINLLRLVSTKVIITVPKLDNATETVTVGGNTISPLTKGGDYYKVAPGATVTVTYAANDGYQLSGTTIYTIEGAVNNSTIIITDTQVTEKMLLSSSPTTMLGQGASSSEIIEIDDESGKYTVPKKYFESEEKAKASTGKGMTYAAAYALGLWDGGDNEVDDLPRTEISIANGKVTVSSVPTPREGYTVTAYLQGKASLSENWPELDDEQIIDAADGSATVDIEESSARFYRVVFRISGSSK